MNSGLPSSVCGSASDSSYTSTDQASIRSSGHTSITSSSTGKPKRTVRFQDPVPEPVETLAQTLSYHPNPNHSLSSLDLSSDDASYTGRSRHSSSTASSIAADKQPQRSASPRFSRPLSMGRPTLRRDVSVASTASAPGELEFTDWLARMEQLRSNPSTDKRATSRGPKSSAAEAEKEHKKKRRSWVNLLVR